MININAFDIFGAKVDFTLNGNEIYKSKFGAACSIIFFLGTSVIGLLCFKDFFDTKNSNVTYTLKEQVNTNESNYKTVLNNSNFFFAFQLFDNDLNPIVATNENIMIVVYYTLFQSIHKGR